MGNVVDTLQWKVIALMGRMTYSVDNDKTESKVLEVETKKVEIGDKVDRQIGKHWHTGGQSIRTDEQEDSIKM